MNKTEVWVLRVQFNLLGKKEPYYRYPVSKSRSEVFLDRRKVRETSRFISFIKEISNISCSLGGLWQRDHSTVDEKSITLNFLFDNETYATRSKSKFTEAAKKYCDIINCNEITFTTLSNYINPNAKTEADKDEEAAIASREALKRSRPRKSVVVKKKKRKGLPKMLEVSFKLRSKRVVHDVVDNEETRHWIERLRKRGLDPVVKRHRNGGED